MEALPARGSPRRGGGKASAAEVPGLTLTSGVTAHSVESSNGFVVHTWAGGNDRFYWGLAASQGRRSNMEDAHLVDLHLDEHRTAMFGIFDGHAGKEVAAYCALHAGGAVLSSPALAAGDMERALADAFLLLEERMKEPAAKRELHLLSQGVRPGDREAAAAAAEGADAYGQHDQAGAYLGPSGGAAACVALVRGQHLSVASVGDSRCVLSSGGVARPLTRDHRAREPAEAERVIRAGLSVVGGRVAAERSTLAMTRALGDTKYKQPHLPPEGQAVSPVPHTRSAHIDAPPASAEAAGVPDFLVLACDGLWDVMSNQQAVTFLQVAMEQGLSPQQAALALVEEALEPNTEVTDTPPPPSRDNITVLVVQFAATTGAAA